MVKDRLQVWGRSLFHYKVISDPSGKPLTWRKGLSSMSFFRQVIKQEAGGESNLFNLLPASVSTGFLHRETEALTCAQPLPIAKRWESSDFRNCYEKVTELLKSDSISVTSKPRQLVCSLHLLPR